MSVNSELTERGWDFTCKLKLLCNECLNCLLEQNITARAADTVDRVHISGSNYSNKFRLFRTLHLFI